jgi:hypothetical protein
MDFQQISTALQRWVPFALLTTLLLDWIRLRAKHRADEKKHIARVMPELLDLRMAMLAVREFPKLLPKLLPRLFPSEVRKQIPVEAYPQIAAQLLPGLVNVVFPADNGFAERYLKVVEEIAGYQPLLAYELRGKERYFNLRGMLTSHMAQLPASPAFAAEVAAILDRECVPVLEETILLIAKAHSYLLWFKVKRRLGKKLPDVEPVFKKVAKVFSAEIAAAVAKENPDALPKPPNQ